MRSLFNTDFVRRATSEIYKEKEIVGGGGSDWHMNELPIIHRHDCIQTRFGITRITEANHNQYPCDDVRNCGKLTKDITQHKHLDLFARRCTDSGRYLSVFFWGAYV